MKEITKLAIVISASLLNDPFDERTVMLLSVIPYESFEEFFPGVMGCVRSFP